MASYKRAIHTVGDYQLVWVLIGHTLQDTDGNFVHLTRLPPRMGKVAEGQERDAALFNQAGTSAGCVWSLTVPMTSLRQMIPTRLDPRKIHGAAQDDETMADVGGDAIGTVSWNALFPGRGAPISLRLIYLARVPSAGDIKGLARATLGKLLFYQMPESDVVPLLSKSGLTGSYARMGISDATSDSM